MKTKKKKHWLASFGKLIKETRKKLKLSIHKEADILNIEDRQLERYEKGDNEPSGEIMLRIIKLLGIDPNQIPSIK